MSDLGGRPLTIITPAMLDVAQAVPGGAIVARRSRCGRYITFQAAQLDDVAGELASGRAVVAADAVMIGQYRMVYGPTAGPELRAAVLAVLATGTVSV